MKSLLVMLTLCLCLWGCGKELATREKAEGGDADAQFNLGVMYHRGNGVKQDPKEAVKWWGKAAEQGDVSAKYMLGVMYEGGYGVKKDLVLAYAWCNIAAADGHESAKRAKQDIGKKLTPEQIAKAEALAKEMIAKNPKLINK
jgi:TPR repeat protein